MSPSYFRVQRRPVKQAGPEWSAAATIIRADTDEPVQRLGVWAASATDADAQLDTQLDAALAALAPPDDWGRDPTVAHLLQRYLQLRDEVYGMVERGTAGAKAYDRSELAKLQVQVEALTDSQRLELATTTTDQLAQVANPYVLDILTAKRELDLVSRRSTTRRWNPGPAPRA